MTLKEKVQKLAKENFDEILAVRRHLHAHPELSFKEVETSKFILNKLQEYEVEFERNIADTGIIAYVKGKNPNKKVVALRADIDALPIIEANNVPYKSKNEGVMHACGHDVHTSSLLGAAKILTTLKNEFEGTVKLLFQPGEELLPGGASLMIKEGALQNPAPQNIVGQHVMPMIPAGKVGFRSGMYMASADELHIVVRGKGGHAAMPELGIDPILITSHIIIALQQIVSRNASPKTPSVLSFGDIHGYGATNIIPNEVHLKGTFRTLNEEWRADAHKRMKKMAESIAEGMGGSVDFEIRVGYPYLENDSTLTPILKNYAIDYLGAENVLDLDIWMASEDFAYYSQEIPATFYRLGIRNEEKGITSGLHTPTFDIDESCLEVSIGLMAWLTISQLIQE